MGCFYSRLEREETVTRCRARKRYMKQLVKARQAFSATHSLYLRALRSTGSALHQFSNAETFLHHHYTSHRPILPSPSPQTPLSPPPPPPPPLSSSTETWSSVTASPALPPPPPPPSSTWDFWDPFMPSSSRPVTEEEWEGATTVSETIVTVTRAASSVAPPSIVSGFSKDTSSTELAMVVSRNTKDLVGIIKELDEYFLKASDAGAQLSLLLEVPNSGFSGQNKGGNGFNNHGWSLSSSIWASGSSPMRGVSMVSGISHCSTVERLYAWEKKLYKEVKDAEILKIEHGRRATRLRKLEIKGADYFKTAKTKKEVEKLESQMMVASQAIESTSSEIYKLREIELYPQLLDLVKGLIFMWRSMYECHQVQTHIVEQLKYLNIMPSAEPTSEIHRQSTLQLELEVQHWHLSFCNLVKAQKDYIQSLMGWLRLSLFQFSKNPPLRLSQDSRIYSLCEEWNLALDRIPDKVAAEGIKSLVTVMHGIVVQQAEENKQKKKSEAAFRDLEKWVGELRSVESKYNSLYSMADFPNTVKKKDSIQVKRAKVEAMKTRAKEEKMKHENTISVTRAMTLNNLQMSFPHVFQTMVGFSSVCMHAYESVHSQAKSTDEHRHVKRLMP